jgi:hypothetical protein
MCSIVYRLMEAAWVGGMFGWECNCELESSDFVFLDKTEHEKRRWMQN